MTLALWQGEFGDSYALRNPASLEAVKARRKLWIEILNAMLPEKPWKVLEVGCGTGNNLAALAGLLPRGAILNGVEPNEQASFAAMATGAPNAIAPRMESFSDRGSGKPFIYNLVFTSGVLIHIHPDELLAFCADIHRRTNRWIVAIEYFSHQPCEVEYRGEMGRLWKGDFGAFYLDNFPDLMPIACGFAWKRLTGLDDLTWWLLEKR